MSDDLETPDSDEQELPFFKCHTCGSRRVRFEQEFEVTEQFTFELPCECGEDDVAATRTRTVRRALQSRGYLRADRNIVEEERDSEDVLEESTEEEVSCQQCFKRYGKNDHRWVSGDSEVEESDDPDLTLFCDGCDREIEFGYSHENKVGRKWLQKEDDRDFNPWRTFPDPKYVESWRAKGWLRENK